MATTNEIFDLIRGQEANFPFPVNHRTITVGTFNATEGTFTYSVPTYEEEVPNQTPGKPPRTVRGGIINAIGAIEVILRFQVRNRIGDVTLSIPGLPAVSTATDAVSISVGAADTVDFTISNAGNTFTSELSLEITRFLVGAGVFELPALPLTIVYAPPLDRSKKNVSSWTVTNTTGNTSCVSIGTETTTSHPVTQEFNEVNQIKDYVQQVAKTADVLKKIVKDPEIEAVLDGISKALNIIADGLGSVSATASQGISVNTQHCVTLSMSNGLTIITDPASGGPGSGDRIYYLKNVKLAWFTQSVGRIQVTILGHDGIGVTSVGFLKNGGS